MKTPEDSTATTLETIADFSGILSQGEFPWGLVTTTGIILRDETSQETWLDLTRQALDMWERLGKTHLALSMKVADLLNWGEERFNEEFAQAIDLTRKSLTQQ